MRVAIMQPYFFPYLGYFQLINAVDLFLLYDDVQYMKGGWINRNRILQNGVPAWFSMPVKHANFKLPISARTYCDPIKYGSALLSTLHTAYRKAPYFRFGIQLAESILECGDESVVGYNHAALLKICAYIGIRTHIELTSNAKTDPILSAEGRVIELCRYAHATQYINAAGGRGLYSQQLFSAHNLELRFIEMDHAIEYCQTMDLPMAEGFDKISAFIPNLSILDLIMFNSQSDLLKLIQKYKVVALE
jgi:hypothetical protein